MEGGTDPEHIRDYRDLRVWQDAMEIAEEIYTITTGFPREEVYGMTSQMRRSSVSIAANIAEGFGRDQRRSFIHYLRIAQGSLKELETHIELSRRVGLMADKVAGDFALRTERLGKMLRAFIRKLEAKEGIE